jgi:hypothetical protein
MAEPNPNGANGTQSDPREETCWKIYVENLAKGKENAYQAAIEAGYEECTAKQITVRSWFLERKAKLKRKEMLNKAERNLDKVLDLDEFENDKINPQLLKIKTDVSTTIVKTLGKEEYSERSEHTGKDGKDLFPKPLLDNVRNNDSIKEDFSAE